MDDRPYVILIYAQRMIFGRKFEHLGNLGISSLAAFLEKNGYKARAFTGISTDAAALFRSECEKGPVAAVGLYCDYDNESCVASLCRSFKDMRGVRTIVGGPHAINLGKDFMKTAGCDHIVRGDGEKALLQIMDMISGKSQRIEDIEGLSYIDGSGSYAENAPREPADDIDGYPPPSTRFELGGRIKRNISVMTARGCPFRCSFCFEGGNTKKLRLRSVEKVMSEIRLGLSENPRANYLWFVDDTFTLDHERTVRFCDELARLREERHFVWFCEGHAAILRRHPGLVERMVSAGMARMQIGMESGCDETLKLYDKRIVTDDVRAVVEISKNAGLAQIAGNFIIGGAGESRDTLERTTRFVEELHEIAPGMIDISTTFVMPLPNTAISRCPRRFGVNIIDPGSFSSTEDFPVNETDGLSRFDICIAAKKFLTRSFEKMKALFESGAVPSRYIEKHLELSRRYGLSSTWYRFIYSKRSR